MKYRWVLAAFALGCGATLAPGGTAHGPVTALVVAPTDPTVAASNGSAAPVAFTARVRYGDGFEEPATMVTWSLDTPTLGTLDATGTFVAGGHLAGVGHVTASADGKTATTSVTVKVSDTILVAGAPSDAPSKFGGNPVTGDPSSPTLDYPLDGALMPSTVKAPDVQWEGGAAGDLYRVVVTGGGAQVAAYLVHSGGAFTYDWPVDDNEWQTLIASAAGAPLTFVVDRRDGASGTVYRSSTRSVTVVGASVAGAIYYWDLSDGRMQVITAKGHKLLLQMPPARPSDGRQCVACHTVSRDGKWLAAELWDGGDYSAVFDLTKDPPPVAVPPTIYKALFQTFDPTASRILANEGTSLVLRDAHTGAALAAGGAGLPSSGAAHPAWSPDGTRIAYVANINGGWAVDYTLGDLAVLPVTGPDMFGAPTVIRPADGMANAWPSFTPDGKWIAFGRGTNSRGKNNGTAYPGSLFLIAATGGNPVELAATNGGAQASYLPSFSPFDAGGYFWLAFYSLRDYGNAQAGTKGTARRQMWVTAIGDAPDGKSDPSHVPYWMPDQDPKTENMSAYWTVEAPVQ